MSYKIKDISDEIVNTDLEDTSLSIASVSFWLQRNIGKLNNLISTSYTLSSNLEFSPNNLSEEEKTIYKILYLIHYYNLKIKESLGAGSVDSVVEVTSDSNSVKRTSRNEFAKTYLALKRDHEKALQDLITSYKLNNSTPLDVSGDDVFDANSNSNDSSNDYNRTS